MKGRMHMLGGPNLGRLGNRETEIYGTVTWDQLVNSCRQWAAAADYELVAAQCDGEGELVQLIHAAADDGAGIVLNAAAYTHTSVAVRDAVSACTVPVIEVHLSQPAAREPFRRVNLLADVVRASVSGFGTEGYRLAIEGLAGLLAANEPA